jgi:steroid delta-isomerase
MTTPTAPESLEAAVHAYVRALNAGDLEAIVALYADDASVEDPVGSAPVVGREAIRAFYARSVAVPLQVALEGPVRVAGRECAFAFSVSVVWEGKRTTFRPIDTFRFDDAGRIAQMRAFFGPGNVSSE